MMHPEEAFLRERLQIQPMIFPVVRMESYGLLLLLLQMIKCYHHKPVSFQRSKHHNDYNVIILVVDLISQSCLYILI